MNTAIEQANRAIVELLRQNGATVNDWRGIEAYCRYAGNAYGVHLELRRQDIPTDEGAFLEAKEVYYRAVSVWELRDMAARQIASTGRFDFRQLVHDEIKYQLGL